MARILSAGEGFRRSDMSFSDGGDIGFTAETGDQGRFARQTGVILEYSQTTRIVLISNAEAERPRRFLMFRVQWPLMQGPEGLMLSPTPIQETDAGLLGR